MLTNDNYLTVTAYCTQCELATASVVKASAAAAVVVMRKLTVAQEAEIW